MEQHGSAHRARAARGSRLRARLGTARRKRRGWLLGRASKRAAQVVLGIGVTAREAGAAELQHRSDLVGRHTTAEQALSDPQIGDAPIRGRETLRNLQAMQPAGVDAASTGRRQRAVGGKGSARRRRPPDRRRSPPDFRLGVMAQSRVGSQLRLRVHQPDPRSRTTRLAACGFLVGEPRQSSAMAPIGTGPVGAVKGGQVCGDGGSHSRLQRSQAEANPGLQMVGAGAQHDRRLMPIGAHGVDGLVMGAIQIEENVAGVAVAGEGVKEDIVSLAIAQPQEGDRGAMGELNSGPNAVSGKGLAAAAVNQTNLVIVAGHGRQLPAHGLQGEEESAIHDRDSNIGSGPGLLKAEVFTLQKSGSFHFALTPVDSALTPPWPWHRIASILHEEWCGAASRGNGGRWRDSICVFERRHFVSSHYWLLF